MGKLAKNTGAVKRNDNSYRGPGMKLSKSKDSKLPQHGGEKVPAKTDKGKSTNEQLGTAPYAGPGRNL